MEMTQADLDEFCEALESGRYQQGMGLLKQRLGPTREEFVHCCLGILSELHKDREKISSCETNDGVFSFFVPREDEGLFDQSNAELLNIFKRKFNSSEAGFKVHKGDLSKDELLRLDKEEPSGTESEYFSAIELNDAGIPFTRIAELARKHIRVINNYEERIPVTQPD